MYCGPECQLQDWGAHKETCRAIAGQSTERQKQQAAARQLMFAVPKAETASYKRMIDTIGTW